MSDSLINIFTDVAEIKSPLKLASGKVIEEYNLKYETYGVLNKEKNNAVLICHALSGNHHAAGCYKNENKPGWWDNMIAVSYTHLTLPTKA